MSLGVLEGPTNAVQAALEEAFFGLLLARDQTGARIRMALTAAILAIHWFIVGLLADFPRVLPEAWLATFPFPFDVFIDLATSFFSPRVLIHVIPVAAGLWIAIRVGEHYLADLFELESHAIASRYLRGALFGWNYPWLEIASPDFDKLDRNNPILRIGGPGFLKVHLGLTTVFERMDGQPVVSGPQQGGTFVPGFNRLRVPVDLRDHLLEVDEVRAVTQDGIEVFARDAQMLARVIDPNPTDRRMRPVQDVLNQAYSHEQLDIFALVYKPPISGRTPRKWTGIPSGIIHREISSFVGRLSIEEFLAMAEWLEEDGGDGTEVTFIPRQVLTERFYSDVTLTYSGLEMVWVNVGTWELREQPGRSEADPGSARTMLAAWRDLQRARRLGSPEALNQATQQAQSDLIHTLLADLVRRWDEAQSFERCWRLFRVIQDLLVRKGLELYGTGSPAALAEYEAAVDHLQALTVPEYLGGPPAS